MLENSGRSDDHDLPFARASIELTNVMCEILKAGEQRMFTAWHLLLSVFSVMSVSFIDDASTLGFLSNSIGLCVVHTMVSGLSPSCICFCAFFETNQNFLYRC